MNAQNKILSITALIAAVGITVQGTSAAVVSSSYVLNTPATNLTATTPYNVSISVPTVTLGKNGWSSYATNSAGEAVILENASSTREAFLLDPSNAAAGLIRVDPASFSLNGTTTALAISSTGIASISAAGAVGGTSQSGLNNAAWVYAPGTGGSAGTTTVLAMTGALTGSAYSYVNTTTSAYTYSQSTLAVGGTGWVVGNATRYSGVNSNSTIGADIWIQNPATLAAGPVIIPLINTTNYYETITATGATNTTYQFSSAVAVNASGTVIGTSSRTLGVSTGSTSTVNYGADAWMYTGDAASPTTTQIGLIGTSTGSYEMTSTYTPTSPATGTHAYQNSTANAVNSAGQVVGTSTVYTSGSTSSAGVLGWVYTASSTPAYGTSGAATYDASTATFINGSSIATAYGTYQQVGLTDSAHLKAGYPNTAITAMNDKGQVIGTSTQYVGTSNVGSDVWYFSGVSGAASISITPTSADTTKYTYGGTSAQFKSVSTNSMNSNGLVAGTASRYVATTTSGTGLGTDAWVYDPSVGTNGTTFIVDYLGGNTSNYESSSIKYLSDSGIALGTYNLYSGTTSSTLVGTYIFAWNENGTTTGNFVTLAQVLTDTTLSDAGWTALSNMLTIGSDGTLYGVGTTTAALGSNPALFTLTAVPEPASLGVIAAGSTMLLARRRKLST